MANSIEMSGDALDDLVEDIMDDDTPSASNDESSSIFDSQDNYEPGDSYVGDNSGSDSYINDFLSEYGIKDGIINYENDDGTTKEVNFRDLDKDEKLNILGSLTSPSNSLTDNEIDTINYLRSNNATMKDIVDYYSNQAVQQYANQRDSAQQAQIHYDVDDYSDDELYVADLKTKYPNMTDEELLQELATAKENEDLYEKKTSSLRDSYKALEQQQYDDAAAYEKQQYQDFSNSIIDEINSFDEIKLDHKSRNSDALQIEPREKENIYRYLLQRDGNGATQFFKDLNDPNHLVELAWFSLYGRDAISDISSYWKSALKSSRNASRGSQRQSTVTRVDKGSRDRKEVDNVGPSPSTFDTIYGDSLLK